MSIALVAAIIIMILLIAFSIIILIGLSAAAGIRIRTDMVKLVSSYDKIIEVKSKELRNIKKELEKLEKQKQKDKEKEKEVFVVETIAPPQGKASVLKRVQYRAQDFSQGYSSIRDNFKIDESTKLEIVKNVKNMKQTTKKRGKLGSKLLDTLSFDTVFQLSQISSEKQLEILSESLENEDKKLLEDYIREYEHRIFDISEFYHWLKEITLLESENVIIVSGDVNSCKNEEEYSEEICEGIQITLGNRLFDYSIKEREIS